MVVENATSLRRGLTLLFALASEESASGRGLGVTQLADLIGRDKSQVSRTLKVLDEFGVVERDRATRQYRIGPRLVAVAAKASHRRLLVAAAPLLKQLVADLNETAYLSVLRGAGVLTVLYESPDRSVLAAGSVGRIVPAFCTSSGRALLLDHGRDELRELFAGESFAGAGPRAPTSVADLRARIAAVRRTGYALVDEEFEAGLVAAAAPVRDFRGRIVAAVNVSAPRFRFADELETAGGAVRAAADRLSYDLGWRPTEEAAQ